MANNYKMNSAELNSIVTSLNDISADYNENVTKLDNLIKEIDGSSAWTDATLKSSFVKSASSYVNLYKKIYVGLNAYTSYLKRKASNSDDIETTFSW